MSLDRCRASIPVNGSPWRCDLLAGHPGNHRARGDDWSQPPSPPCVADLTNPDDEKAVIVDLAEAVHLHHAEVGPWWKCESQACQRALMALPVTYLAAAMEREHRRHPKEGV